MSDTEKKGDGYGTAEHINAAPKRGCVPRLVAHYKKFWWAHLIALVVVVLVVALPLVYVGYPKIAQDDVHESTLEITAMQITDPKADSLHVEITQVIGSESIFHPDLEAFEAIVSLAGSETPFTTLSVPPIRAVDGAEAIVDQVLKLGDDNSDAFAEYSKAVMHNEVVELEINGKTGLKLGALPTTEVDYNKVVSMKGLNSLKGFKITEIGVPTKEDNLPEDDPTNMIGEVLIPNPSVLTLTMGNLTLNLSVDGEEIGYSYLNDVIIKPGDNNIKMTSVVDLSAVVGFISGDDAKYSDGLLPVQIVGNSSVYNGEELPYFSEALKSNKLAVELDTNEILGGGS